MYNQKLRPRRMRISPAMRAMVRETQLSAKDFVYPLFVVPGENVKEEIPSMPGCYHLSVDHAVKTARECWELGIPSVEIFGIPEYKDEDGSSAVMEFEPQSEEAIDLIIPKYITSLIYGALIESVASENGARMQAMDSATSNADDMISKLSLLYNRARQSSITQELTEIIAGAEAIS